MGVRTVAIFGLGAVLTAGFVLGWVHAGNEPGQINLPVPRFGSANGDPNATQVARRQTLLPADCAEVLTGPVDAAALLAQPTGSVTVRGVIGVPSPSVGLLERVTCNYFPADPRVKGAPVLVIGLAAFTDPASAAAQRERNIAAERTDTLASRPVPLGENSPAAATLLTQRDNYLLMVTYDRYTVTASVHRRLVPEANAEAVLVDLVRRVWPGVLPPGTPGSPAPKPGAPAAPAAPGAPAGQHGAEARTLRSPR